MNVMDMINLMGTLGIGEVSSDKDSKRIALTYLNLAHDQLYSETANLNEKLFVDETHASIAGQDNFTLYTEPFSLIGVWVSGQPFPLRILPETEFYNYKKRRSYSGAPEICSIVGNKINFFPNDSGVSYTFNVKVCPNITPLQENTPESSIPYPILYHRVLINGALRYMFNDEAGFKNTTRENEAAKEWDNGRFELITYLYNFNRQSNYTYSNA